MVSVQTMIKQVEGLQGTGDLTDWEQGFVSTVSQYRASGKALSPKQVETLEKVWSKHFA